MAHVSVHRCFVGTDALGAGLDVGIENDSKSGAKRQHNVHMAHDITTGI